jgi:hypothetical protein
MWRWRRSVATHASLVVTPVEEFSKQVEELKKSYPKQHQVDRRLDGRWSSA